MIGRLVRQGGLWPAFAAALAVACAGQAHALSLRDLLGGVHSYDGRVSAPPPVARYEVEDDGAFVLDRSGPVPLLRFEGGYEIWALKASPAARGDTIYRNDVGQPVLRATRLGGITVFTPERPSGAAAALSGPAAPLELRPVTSGPALLQILTAASIRATHAARHLVAFEAPDASRGSAALIADAAGICVKAIEMRAQSLKTRASLARTKMVRLRVGERADAHLEKGVLEVVVAPEDGTAGRPSSRRIERVLAR